MRIRTFIPLITCLLMPSMLFLNACVTTQAPAPVEVYGANNQSPNVSNSSALDNFDGTGPTKVAILLPLSGPNADLGQAMLQAAQLAVFDINNDGFELIPHDTKGTFDGGEKAAENAINNDAQIILGPLFADAVRGAKKIATPNDVKIIAFSTDWTLGNTATFLMGFMPFSQVDRIANYATSQRLNRFAIIAPQGKYGDAVTAQFKQRVTENGGSIASTINFIPNDAAVVSQINAINPNDIDAVFIPTGSKDLEVITNALNNMLTDKGMSPSKIKRLGTGLWDDTNIANMMGIQGGWFAAPPAGSRQGFEQKYQSTYGQVPPRIATLAYDATALSAILSTKGYGFNVITDPNGYAGIDGVFKFGANGLIQRNLAVFEINKGTIKEIAPATKSF